MSHSTRLRATCALLLLTLLAASGPAVAASELDASKPTETHCVVEVIGQESDGEFILSKPVCDDTRAAAYAAVEASSPMATSFTIGVHYDGFNFTGSSFSVVGSNCAGGYVNLNSTWVNRVSSTANGCYRVTHYDGYNKTGAAQSTLGFGGNLSALNNDANSIAYYAS